MRRASPRNRQTTMRRARLLGNFVAVGLMGCFAMISCLRASAASPQTGTALSQAEIRAAFIFNFPKFAEWPTQTYADAGAPLTVCFLGADDVRSAFQSISAGKALNGRLLENRTVKSAEDIRSCQVLYVDLPRSPAVLDALKYARHCNSLAIGTSDDFLTCGGMIRLQIENKRMRFDVNVGAVGRTKIKLSSKLLALARSVVDLPDPAGN